eukprot:6191661-Pleurochrysis_carterae.AAC.2
MSVHSISHAQRRRAASRYKCQVWAMAAMPSVARRRLAGRAHGHVQAPNRRAWLRAVMQSVSTYHHILAKLRSDERAPSLVTSQKPHLHVSSARNRRRQEWANGQEGVMHNNINSASHRSTIIITPLRGARTHMPAVRVRHSLT